MICYDIDDIIQLDATGDGTRPMITGGLPNVIRG